jgi:hypothetical protein
MAKLTTRGNLKLQSAFKEEVGCDGLQPPRESVYYLVTEAASQRGRFVNHDTWEGDKDAVRQLFFS